MKIKAILIIAAGEGDPTLKFSKGSTKAVTIDVSHFLDSRTVDVGKETLTLQGILEDANSKLIEVLAKEAGEEKANDTADGKK